jgi:hypothetical protein
MATSTPVVKTKVTDTFTVVGDNGETYTVEQHTRYENKKVDGVKTEILGKSYFLTSDGRGVLKNEKDGSYSIPSLNMKATKREGTA